MAKTDFEVYGEMAKADKDIRMFTTLVGCQKVKQGGTITMGVDAGTMQEIALQAVAGQRTHYVVLYVVNKEQFEKIKKEG